MRVFLALVLCLAPLQAAGLVKNIKRVAKQADKVAGFVVEAPVRAAIGIATGVADAAKATWPGPFGPQPPATPTAAVNPAPVMDPVFEQYRRHMDKMHPATVARLQELRRMLEACGGNTVCWRHAAGFIKAYKPNPYYLIGVTSNLGEDMNDWDLNLYGLHLCIEQRSLADYIKLPCFQ